MQVVAVMNETNRKRGKETLLFGDSESVIYDSLHHLSLPPNSQLTKNNLDSAVSPQIFQENDNKKNYIHLNIIDIGLRDLSKSRLRFIAGSEIKETHRDPISRDFPRESKLKKIIADKQLIEENPIY